jgi:hypothetical protein
MNQAIPGCAPAIQPAPASTPAALVLLERGALLAPTWLWLATKGHQQCALLALNP